ncbi:hypothetical protein [Nitratifractor salsuginis]|uniref:Uncharacterized protein n=1 Tax=Nitratifractor salsuginis (strain DSM 16511 / JCM 12458 / E9I37-1) TaxID=749222 RepID=E6WY43_NITSE|nr:hypothetical protein [Nitratifractor salsuginis]ADV46417.1 hypothetical protein Nitsa_1164 [Nitratifractor salsuginis DSM 16511]
MKTYQVNQNFVEALSTRRTLFGAPATDFVVYYAPLDNLAQTTVIDGGMTEAVEEIGTAHTATTTAASPYGSRVLHIDSANGTLEEGDVIEYASGKYAYIMKIAGDKVYLKTKLRANVASGATLTQVGNTGEYASGTIAIPAAGEYSLTIESPSHGIVVTDRVRITEEVTSAPDTDAPEEDTVAVAY